MLTFRDVAQEGKYSLTLWEVAQGGNPWDISLNIPMDICMDISMYIHGYVRVLAQGGGFMDVIRVLAHEGGSRLSSGS